MVIAHGDRPRSFTSVLSSRVGGGTPCNSILTLLRHICCGCVSLPSRMAVTARRGREWSGVGLGRRGGRRSGSVEMVVCGCAGVCGCVGVCVGVWVCGRLRRFMLVMCLMELLACGWSLFFFGLDESQYFKAPAGRVFVVEWLTLARPCRE